MVEQTPTSKILNTLEHNGFSDVFLWDLTNYSPKLLKDARNGYIEFIGSTLNRLEHLVALCNNALEADRAFSITSFLEHHYIQVEDNRYIRFGDMFLAGLVTCDEALEEYLNTATLITFGLLESLDASIDDALSAKRESQRYIVAARNGKTRPIPLKMALS